MNNQKQKTSNKLHKLLKACVSSGAMAWALMSGVPAYAGPDACTVTGTAAVCEGDQSAGVTFTSGIEELTVQNLSDDISSVATPGIHLYNSAAPVVLNTDLGSFGVRTTGLNAYGLFASSDVGAITINHSGDIVTTGGYSHGILVSGGSDSTNNSPFTINVASGNISTSGDYSRGIRMIANSDSVGTVNNAGTVRTMGAYADGIEIAAGAGLNFTNTGAITTEGLQSDGIVAVLLNGESDISNSGAVSALGQQSHGINAFVRNGNLTLTNSGDVTTLGNEGKALYGEVVTGNAVIVNSGVLTTSGLGSYGMQSSSQLGDIDVTHTGTIATSGDYSHGIILGLGRGDLLLDIQGDVSTTGSEASALYFASNYGSINGTISGALTTTGVAGYGIRAEARGSDVNLELSHDGSISTTALFADAIAVNIQDVPGDAPAMLTLNGSIQTSGENAEGLNAKAYNSDVLVNLGGDINTQGTQAYGIVVEATDGASQIVLDGLGNIVTRGQDSVGIYNETTGNHLNSVSMGEGAAIRTTGSAAHGVWIDAEGDVEFSNHGSLRVGGSGSDGLLITQSAGSTLSNNGTIEGGSGNGWAIHAEGAGDTALINNGTITALSSNALLFGGGDDTVSNFGRIEGDVDMGAGNNAFTNEATGELVLWDEFTLTPSTNMGGSEAKVAVAGELSNNGLLYVYGDGAIGTSVINGNLYQSGIGTLIFDADASSFTTDYLVVNGDADLSGVIRLNLQNVPVNLADAPDFPTDIFSYSIIRADSLTTGEGLTFDPSELTIENTVAYTFALRAENGQIFVDVLEMTSNFEDMLDVLATDYQKDFALYLDRQQGAADTTGIQPLVDALRNLPDATALQASFNAFAPFSVVSQDRILRNDARYMLSAPETCSIDGEASVCFSAGVDYGETSGDLDMFAEDYDVDRTAMSFALGVSMSENWQLDVASRIGSDDFRLPGETSSDQDGYLLSVGATGVVFDGVELGLIGLVGNASADVSRASILSATTRLTSEQEMRVQGIAARVAYPIVAGDWSITPGLTASNVCIDADAYSEAGGLADAISVDGHDSCLTAVGPQLLFETPTFSLGGFQTTGFAQLGYEALDDDGITVSAALVGAGLADDRFVSEFEGDGDNRMSASFGLEGRSEGGWSIRAGADFLETDTQTGWSAGLSIARAL